MSTPERGSILPRLAGLCLCVQLCSSAAILSASPAAPAEAGGREMERDGDARGPVCVSGIYPHLAAFSRNGECGIGAVVPWADRLWTITYPPHATRGSSDKLYEIEDDGGKMLLTIRPESVGGTHASRMIHRESNQLVIGPYFIDAERNVRACDLTKLAGRMTGAARHLTDPANLIYLYDMEGAVYEVDVRSLAVKRLFKKPVPGDHGKGAYTGQGRLVVSNNGERRVKSREALGALAEWDGREWRVIERKQFTDVTGPGGILGAPDDTSPVWSIGWDRRSVIIKLLDGGAWSTFRLPKATHSYDPAHGWYTEWPRIREVAPDRPMMDMHGMFYDFPKGFRAGRTGGIRAISSHLRYIPDFCGWRGRVVLASDDASMMRNPMAGQSQSNLWFGPFEELRSFGPRSGWGGVWLGDRVEAGVPSEPFLVAGFERRCLHLSTGAGAGAGASSAMRCTGKYAMSELPPGLAGLTRVTVARGDYHRPAPGYSFTVGKDVVVYIAVDDRGRPALPYQWKKTGMTTRWQGFTDSVYVRRFAKGRVTVPPHDVAHKPDAYGLPHTCFLKDPAPGAGRLEVTDLPEGRGAEVVRPEAAPVDGEADVTFVLETDAEGDGDWQEYERVTVPAGGYRYRVFPSDLRAEWTRVTADTESAATAYFHLTSPRRAAEEEDDVFAGLARVDETGSVLGGLVRPAGHNRNLQYLARLVGEDGVVAERYYEVDEKMRFVTPAEDRSEEVKRIAAVTQDFEVDDASVIMLRKGKRYRLPKGDARYDGPFAAGRPRGIRECVSERYLMNVHGTLYELPRDDGLPLIKPVATHNRQIMDFCTWRGLMVVAGCRAPATRDGHIFRSDDKGEDDADPAAALWFGSIDDLWKLGKPVGRGGPWLATPVESGAPSDPYLMTGYDRKTVELSHDEEGPVTFTLEVDFDHAQWKVYDTFKVPPNETVRHVFPEGYSAHWVRARVDGPCRATVLFVYE